jgi:hypothetical protein
MVLAILAIYVQKSVVGGFNLIMNNILANFILKN